MDQNFPLMKAYFFWLFWAIPHLFLNHKPCGSYSVIHSFLLVAPFTHDFLQVYWATLILNKKIMHLFSWVLWWEFRKATVWPSKQRNRDHFSHLPDRQNSMEPSVCVCVLVLTGATSPQRFTAFPCHLLFSNFTWCLVTDPNVKCICARVCGHVGTGGDRSGSGSSHECVWVLCSWWHVWCERERRRGSEWANNRGSGKDKAIAWHTQTHTIYFLHLITTNSNQINLLIH